MRVILLTLGKIMGNFIDFRQVKNLDKTPLGETGCLAKPYFLHTGSIGIQFFDSPLSQHSQLGYLWLPTPHCAAYTV